MKHAWRQHGIVRTDENHKYRQLHSEATNLEKQIAKEREHAKGIARIQHAQTRVK